eukprot:3290373-Lingulodinium_polyedra.AAC.1
MEDLRQEALQAMEGVPSCWCRGCQEKSATVSKGHRGRSRPLEHEEVVTVAVAGHRGVHSVGADVGGEGSMANSGLVERCGHDGHAGGRRAVTAR